MTLQVVVGLGVWTRITIPEGSKYGPYMGAYKTHIEGDSSEAWEVSWDQCTLVYQQRNVLMGIA